MKESCKITVTLLYSVLLFGTCSKKEKSSQISTSHSKVARVSKSSTEKKKVIKDSSNTGLSSSIPVPNNQDSSNDRPVAESGEVDTQENFQLTTSTTASPISVEDTANGDFPTIIRTWGNDLGEPVAADSNDQVNVSGDSDPYSAVPGTIEGNVFFGGIFNPIYEVGGVAFAVIPVGTANSYSEEVIAVDTIVIE